MSAEREKLTIKNKGVGMWQTYSQVELIEKKLKEDTKATILNNFIKFIDIPDLNYNEIYQKNMTVPYLTMHIAKAYKDLKNAVKYPPQFPKLFDNMCREVQAFLDKEIGAESLKFQEALDGFFSKSNLPKVPLSTPGCS